MQYCHQHSLVLLLHQYSLSVQILLVSTLNARISILDKVDSNDMRLAWFFEGGLTLTIYSTHVCALSPSFMLDIT